MAEAKTILKKYRHFVFLKFLEFHIYYSITKKCRFYISANRSWVDNQTTIIGTDSVTFNTGNNTKIKGALITNVKEDGTDGGNLALNTKTLTFENIKDIDETKSSGYGFSTTIGKGSSTNTNNPGQQNNYFPDGSTTISLNNQGHKKEQDTRATIGNGTINITDPNNSINSDISALNRDINNSQVITKDTITNALNIKTTFDNRLFTKGGRNQIGEEVAHLPENLNAALKGNALLIAEPLKAMDNIPYAGKIVQQITSPVTGLVYTFYENDSKLYLAGPDGNKIEVSRADLTKYYDVNGILTNKEKAESNYLLKTKNEDLTIRHNPTHGFLGDLIESKIGQLINNTGLEGVVAMNRLVADDIYHRKDIEDGINNFHSQGTIIGIGAMNLYKNTYMRPIKDFDSSKSENAVGVKDKKKEISYTNQINKNQMFNAVGPAVTKDDWTKIVGELNLNVENNKENNQPLNYNYEHDKRDFVQFLAAPNNLSEFGRGWYLVGQDIGNILIGNTKDLNFYHHDVTNPLYLQHSLDKNTSANVQGDQIKSIKNNK